jgi:hypothetical protein
MRAPHGPLSRRQLFATLIGAGGAAILLAANDATAAPAKSRRDGNARRRG